MNIHIITFAIADKASVRLRLNRTARVYALGLDGARKGEVSCECSDGELRFTAVASNGFLYYEVVPCFDIIGK